MIGGIAALVTCLLLLLCFLPSSDSDKPASKSSAHKPGESPAPLTGMLQPAQLTVDPTDQPPPLVKAVAPIAAQVLPGRFVRIELTGNNRTLCLAEVEIFSDGVNVALKGKAVQSSTYPGQGAEKAIDGNTDGMDTNRSISQTNASKSPYWEVDLGSEYTIERIVIWNRTDLNYRYSSRLAGFTLIVKDGNGAPTCRIDNVPAPKQKCILQPVAEDGKQVRLSWSMDPPISSASVANP
jgi:hypothetical protein